MESELRAYYELYSERFVIRERRPAVTRRAAHATTPWPAGELWLDEAALVIHQAEVARALGHPHGRLAVTSQPLPEAYPGLLAGRPAGGAGAAAVLLTYDSPRGAALLDRRLYLPEDCFGPTRPAADLENMIPSWATYRTGPALGIEMTLASLHSSALPVSVVALDRAYLGETDFLDALHHQAVTYVIETDRHQRLWRRPAGVPDWRPHQADVLAAHWRPAAWLALDDQELAAVRVGLDRLSRPGPEGWLIVRRPAGQPAVDQWRFFLSNAPAGTPAPELAALTAWQGPSQAVLSQCQFAAADAAPGWAGWHHQATLTMLAHYFCLQLGQRFGAAMPALTVPQARQILQAILPLPEFTMAPALAEIEHIQIHNLSAYFHLDEAGETSADPETVSYVI